MMIIVLFGLLSVLELNDHDMNYVFGGEQCLGHFMWDKHII